MSHTLEPYKWYYAYQAYPSKIQEIGKSECSGCKIVKNVHPLQDDLITYIFNDREKALDYAIECGEFEGLFKDEWYEKENEILFELCEKDLEDYSPICFR